MKLQRTIQAAIDKARLQYPVLTIVGPRQVGKTTLVRAMFPNKPYVNLEAPDIRAFAVSDPKRFITQFRNGAVIDEIQHAPELLSYIQVIVDEAKQMGQFIVTGSQQMNLHAAVSQSLAGRTSIISMLPLSFVELANAGLTLTTDEYLLHGFMPALYERALSARDYYRNYVMTYLERDLRHLSKVHDLNLFQRFLKLCAGRAGCLINQSNLANEVGVSTTTIQQWLSLLEASYLIFRIQPYFENLGKRVTKTAKLYFFDVGLLSYLLDIETPSQLSHDPLRGQLFENMVVLECIKTRLNDCLAPNLYYFRDSNHNEVDLIYKQGLNLIPLEIKSAETAHASFTKGLHYFKELIPNRVPYGYVIYGGELEYNLHGFELYNYKHIAQLLKSISGEI